MKKTRVKMNKTLYLGISILDISKILVYEFWYSTYNKKDEIPLFDTSTYNKKDEIPLPIEKNKKVPGLFKDELGGKIIKFVALRPKTYSYLHNCYEHKKAKGTKKCVIKQKIMFQNFKDCLFNNKNVYRSQERF